MRKVALQMKKATEVPPGFRQVRIIKPGSKKGHTQIECCAIIHTVHGDYPCSFTKRKDTLPKMFHWKNH